MHQVGLLMAGMLYSHCRAYLPWANLYYLYRHRILHLWHTFLMGHTLIRFQAAKHVESCEDSNVVSVFTVIFWGLKWCQIHFSYVHEHNYVLGSQSLDFLSQFPCWDINETINKSLAATYCQHMYPRSIEVIALLCRQALQQLHLWQCGVHYLLSTLDITHMSTSLRLSLPY